MKMEFTINTAKLANILTKVEKGTGSSKILPITEYFRIETGVNGLLITSTDNVNFITYFVNDIETEEDEAIVKASEFVKLIQKTTVPQVTITKKEKHLEVKGNGTYKIALYEGEAYPEYEFNFEAPSTQIETSALRRMFSVNESAIAKDMIMPCLTGYNVGETCITTDGVKMCINSTPIFNQPILITQDLANLLGTLFEEKVNIQKDENKILFKTESIIIFGTELAGIEEYPDITPILEVPYDNRVSVKKEELLQVLDRLGIFVDPFDNNGVKFDFAADGLVVQDIKGNSVETIEYKDANIAVNGVHVVNLKYITDIIKAVVADEVKIYFGEELPLKVEEGNVTLILSTMDV